MKKPQHIVKTTINAIIAADRPELVLGVDALLVVTPTKVDKEGAAVLLNAPGTDTMF